MDAARLARRFGQHLRVGRLLWLWLWLWLGSAFGGGGGALAAEQGTVRIEKPARVLHVGDYPHGANVLDDDRAGLAQGFAPTVLHAIADPHAIMLVRRHLVSLGSSLEALVTRRIDVLPLPCALASVDKGVWFSEPYAEPRAGAVVGKGHTYPRKLADLAGWRVALERRAGGGSISEEWLPPARIVEVDDARHALELVASGRVDAFVGIHETNAAIIDALGYGSLVSAPLPLAVPLCLAANRADTETVSLIANGLASLSPAQRREMQWQLMSTAAFDAAQRPFTLTREERHWLSGHRVIRVGIERLNRPYDFIDEHGEWRGTGAVLLKRFASIAQIDFKAVLIDDARTLADALREGTVDLATAFPLPSAPAAGLSLTRPYDSFPWSVVAARGAAPSVQRLAANAWRVQQLQPAADLSGVTIVPRERAVDALRAVLAGSADAALVNRLAAEELGDRYAPVRLTVDSNIAGIERVGFAAAASNAMLANMLERYLASYTQAELARLSSRYRPVSVLLGYDKRAVITLSLGAAVLVSVALSVLLWAYWRTRAARRAAEASRIEAIASRERAQAADRAKSAFVAMMSHEIRTPMNGIVGVLDLFDAMPLAPEQRHYLDVAQRSGRLMLRVIDDTLDYLKMERGALTLEAAPFDLASLVASTVELHVPLAHRKGLLLYLAVMPHFDRPIVGDEARLNQILTNLLSNAIRFTTVGHVLVEARHRIERGRSKLQLVVSDTGRGISEAYRSHLFAPFTQQDSSTTRRYGGTGLGLSIVKHLVDAMGGTIDVQSTAGAGTRVRVELPIMWGEPFKPWPDLRSLVVRMHVAPAVMAVSVHATLVRLGVRRAADSLVAVDACISLDARGAIEVSPAQGQSRQVRSLDDLIEALTFAAARPDAGAPEQPLQPAAPTPACVGANAECVAGDVLVIEDNDVNRDIIVRQLELLGVQASTAVDGIDGYGRWALIRPRLVLLDCHMPGMDGYTIARRIRACEAQESKRRKPQARTTIVAISANATPEDVRACSEAGMDDYVSKPITRRKLVALFEKWKETADADDSR